jgi:PhzF family phenazine biosynthesis protein
VPSCGHATIRDGSDYRIVMTQGAIEFGEPFDSAQVDEILAALGLAAGSLDERCPIQIVSTGHSKVLVGIDSRDTLNSLTPDPARLSEISGRIGCNGYFVFTLATDASDILAHGRNRRSGSPRTPLPGTRMGRWVRIWSGTAWRSPRAGR